MERGSVHEALGEEQFLVPRREPVAEGVVVLVGEADGDAVLVKAQSSLMRRSRFVLPFVVRKLDLGAAV